MDKIKWIITIDPGSNTGLMVYNYPDAYVRGTHLGDLWSSYDLMLDYDPEETLIVIENPAEIKKVWGRDFKQGGNIDKRMQTIAQSVGMNKREGSLLAKRMKDLGYQVLTPTPKGLGKKWTAQQYFDIMCIPMHERTRSARAKKNQHVWDAARLLKWLLRQIK